MRKNLLIFPLLLCATPAVARPVPQLPPELTDPQTAQKLANAVQLLSQAFLNVRVGEVKAALEGREASPQERNMTVGDLARQRDPDFDRHMQQRVASVGPIVKQGVKTLNQTLPAIMHDLADAEKSLDRAVANLPDPTYPRR
ncbi:MAG TPA: hypothetical protein VF776_09275 [Sphingomicrobium sp.]